ncbi:hypothetical protein [Sinomicrobium sp. M5D2P9]
MKSIGWVIVIVILFLLVMWNNRRSVRKWKNRKGKSFRDNYYDRKKEKQTGKEEETDKEKQE